MAALTTSDQKRELVRQLDAARLQFGQNIRGFRHDLNVGSKVRGQFDRHTGAWLGGAALFGWLIAMLKPKKEKVLVDRATNQRVKTVRKTGFLLGLLKLIVNLVKPTLMAYATKKIADLGATSERAAQKSEQAVNTSQRAAATSQQAKSLAHQATT
jgi:hypothetical protein